MDATRRDDYVEVFRSDGLIAAQKIVDVILAPGGIEAQIHDRKDLALAGIGQPGAFFIAVPASQREKAVGLIDEARENGFLDEDEVEKV
jgi:hypothetical protein